MSLSHLSPAILLGGLALISVGLFLLQRLRVRHRRAVVVTTLFWREATEESRARALVRRFRHPLAYLLLLIICSLLWIALAGPVVGSHDARHTMLLLDGSARMARENRFEETVELLAEQLRGLPRDRRRVIFCGARERTLLLPGENPRLLDERLAGLRPEACPATVERTLRELAPTLDASLPLSIVVLGDAPVRPGVAALLPEGVEVRRLAPEPAGGEGTANRGITALGVTPASAGRWDRVDVLVELGGGGLRGETPLSVLLGEQPWSGEAVRSGEGERERVLLRDLPARGELLTVRLGEGDPLPADDEARIALPRRPRIRVALSAGLEDLLGPALAADPAVLLTRVEPDVAVRRRGEETGGGAPALELVPRGERREAILLRYEASSPPPLALLGDLRRLGLEEIDALAGAGQARTMEIGAAPGSARAVEIWEELLGDRYNLLGSRFFPLLVASSVRWLAGARDFPPFVAAGEPLDGSRGAHVGADGERLDPVGASFIPPRAGVYGGAGGAIVAASLLDRWTTEGGPEIEIQHHEDGSGSDRGADLATWIAALALALILLEWLLYRSGRIP